MADATLRRRHNAPGHPPGTATLAGAHALSAGADRWRPLVLAVVVTVVLFAVVGYADANLSKQVFPPPAVTFPDQPWLDGWIRWDSGWYLRIATEGYSYSYQPGRQSPVAFFPAYPLAMRLGEPLTGSALLAGILVTLASGLALVTVFHRWALRRLSPSAAWTAVLVLVLYPYAFYLFGAVYADALFTLSALGAFVLLERGHPVLAGLAGAVATASRPMGIAVVVGLAVLAFTRRRRAMAAARSDPPVSTTGPAVAPVPPPATAAGARRTWVGAAVAAGLASLGLAAYSAYLWARFADPLAFVSAEAAWGQTPGPRTWLKLAYFDSLLISTDRFHLVTYLAPRVLTLLALALVPLVVRRFGWAYGAYVIVVVGIPTLGSKDFFGAGRYLLAAFPCFAVAGELLAGRLWLKRVVLAGSGVGLLLLTSSFARGFYVS